MTLSTEYIEYKKSVERKRKLVSKHQQELDELLSKCPHEEIVHMKKYVPGGYLNTDYTRHWNECTLCHERSPETIENHGSYG